MNVNKLIHGGARVRKVNPKRLPLRGKSLADVRRAELSLAIRACNEGPEKR
jgi:hypothetical protein